MENPVKDIKAVIFDLVASESSDTQQTAVHRYYAPNAGFRNPFVRVDPGPLSREQILGIWQWYRILSPKASIHVENVVYDKPHNILLVDVTQEFHLFFSPLESATSRALTRLTLTEDKGLYFIALQEDFYEPEGVAAMIYAPLASLAGFTLRTFASISNLLAKSFQVLNYWRPKKTGIAYSEECTERRADSCQKPNGNVDRSKNKRSNRSKIADVNVQLPKLAEQELGGVDSDKPGYKYRHEVLLDDKGQTVL
ncbi:hypothetical protein JOM56_004913 [Amanita muscaria]